MDLREMRANGLSIKDQHAGDEGRVLYAISLEHPKLQTHKAIFPGVRQMKRLAKKFLSCEYSEKNQPKRSGTWLFFSIDSGTSPEDRAAFLGAVAFYTKFEARS